MLSRKGRFRPLFIACATALAWAPAALAHAHLSPPVVQAKDGQEFVLTVPTEKENAKTTGVELTLPKGFSIDSFAPAPGWKRNVQSTGTGENTVIQKVTWSGGSVPTEEFAEFRFVAGAGSSKTYRFNVRQTYSDGSIVDWSGPESSDTPAPTVKAVSSLGGGGSTSILAIAAAVLAGLALLLAVAGLAGRLGRSLT